MRALTQYEAVLFDLDGVLTPTEAQMRARFEMFTEYFEAYRLSPPHTDADYFH
jgi:beta-phosphoglucomutase-like phosphatase (HAD superfamily)